MDSNNNILNARKLHFRGHIYPSLIAGIALLLMAIIAGIAYGYLHNQIVVPEDANATAQSISAYITEFKIEIVLWWIIFLLDIVVSISLFIFFKDIGLKLSLFTMILRLLYSVILSFAIIILTTALFVESEALERINLFDKIWSAGLIFFGFHLLLLGFLSKRKKITPIFLSLLLIVSGFCYIILHSMKSANLFLADIAAGLEPILSLPMAMSEITLAIWLVYGSIKGLRNLTISS